MKYLFVTCLVLLSVWTVSAQEINFDHSTLQEALAKAKKAKKPLFVDVYATWCGPCKYMAKTAFTDKEVADFYNENFISLKLDGEKNDGPEVMRNYQIGAYPTLLYFNAEGNLVTKIVGGQDAAFLLRKAKMVLMPETDPVFIARRTYFNSPKNIGDLKNYVGVMQMEANDSLMTYSQEYVSRKPDLDLNDPVEMDVFFKTNFDYQSALGQQFLNKVNDLDADTYLGKLNDYIRVAMQQAIQNKDFSVVERTIHDLFVYVQQVKRDNLPTEEDFLNRLRNDYNKQVNG